METIQAFLKDVKETETTSSIINALDMCEDLKFTTCNSFEKRCLSLMYVEYGECDYERKSDWMRLVNKLNSYDDTPIKRMITGDKKSLDWGGAIVHRQDIDYSEDGFMIEFKEPVQLVIEQIGDKYLTKEVTKIQGKTTWEWYHRKSHNEDLGNYAGCLEVFIYNVEVIS